MRVFQSKAGSVARMDFVNPQSGEIHMFSDSEIAESIMHYGDAE